MASLFSRYKTLLYTFLAILTAHIAVSAVMRYFHLHAPSLIALSHPALARPHGTVHASGNETSVNLSWHAPIQSNINSLSSAINGTGIYGFVFNSSQGPLNTYNWCNMPHVNTKTYPRVKDPSYKLEYVEVIHRHHKRTPYADNTFPIESYPWDCSDEGLFYGGKPIHPTGKASADTYWSVYTSPSNPLRPQGFQGTCQFPQITRGGLDDSHQHGVDLKAVYADLLHFIPADYDPSAVSYRVTNNVITSQVASMLTAGMYPSRADKDTPLLIQPDSIDSLEPGYSCPSASALFSTHGSGSSSPAWRAHLEASAQLFETLDAISGVPADDTGFHMSWDHYFDNLSARLCHQKPLPCNIDDPSMCVTMAQAEEVFRLGQYEYSLIYRDSEVLFPASVASYGIWIAEVAQNLRDAMGMEDGRSSYGNRTSKANDGVRYRHNVAHDGSMSRLLSILQVEKMVWPGMGAEAVMELYSKDGGQTNDREHEGGEASKYYLRVLWGGQVLRSSNPSLGVMDMVPVETVLAYFDGLAGMGASKVPGLCEA